MELEDWMGHLWKKQPYKSFLHQPFLSALNHGGGFFTMKIFVPFYRDDPGRQKILALLKTDTLVYEQSLGSAGVGSFR